jgi:acyl-CoA synthetase (AMP-forming)/AMP-acid ligase II
MFPLFTSNTDRVALLLEDSSVTYAELEAEAARASDLLAAVPAYAHPAEVSARAFGRLLAAARLGTPVVLLPAVPSAELVGFARRELGAWLPDSSAPPSDAPRETPGVLPRGAVVILTSGTSGTPKAVQHSWTSLSGPVRYRADLDGAVWLLTYPYHLYAGLQVVLQVLLGQGTIVAMPADPSPVAVLRRMAQARVEFVSATPSFFRHLLSFGGADQFLRLRVRQLTLGGERVGQDTLDSLRSRFPSARLVHIYATSELGRCFAVTDGREGFPARWLEEPLRDGVRLRIRDGQLEVRPAFPMTRYAGDRPAAVLPDGWCLTGDLVEQLGDRVFFRGRRSDLINVGGFKVNPVRVEDVLRTGAGVRDARVFARRSTLAGELVAAEIALAPGTDETVALAAVRAILAGQLTEAERPRFIKVVREIRRTTAGKIARREGGTQ